MAFEILANIDNKIERFPIPLETSRNGHLFDRINHIYSNKRLNMDHVPVQADHGKQTNK